MMYGFKPSRILRYRLDTDARKFRYVALYCTGYYEPYEELPSKEISREEASFWTKKRNVPIREFGK